MTRAESAAASSCQAGWSARGMRAATTTVGRSARSARVRGSGGPGAAPPSVRCSRSGARGRGFRRGAQHPLASPNVRTLGRLAYAQLASRLWRSYRP